MFCSMLVVWRVLPFEVDDPFDLLDFLLDLIAPLFVPVGGGEEEECAFLLFSSSDNGAAESREERRSCHDAPSSPASEILKAL